MSECPEPEKVQAYVDGELPGSEAVQIAEHISRCSHCEAVHRWLALISHSLSAQPRPQPAPELLEAIRGAVDRAEPVAQISCSDAQSLISAHLDEELTAQEQLLMWTHLFSCEVCYQQFIQTQQITKALRRAEPVALPTGLEAGIHNAVEAEIARREVGVISLLRWRISKRVIGATAPPEVSGPAEVPATTVQPADVKQPAVAQSATSPRPVIARAHRAPARETAVPVAASKPPTTSPRPVETSRPGATLASAGTEALKPVSPVQPPTDTASGPRLALYQPGATPAPPAAREKPSRIEYTPIATAGKSIYANLEPVTESRLDAASAEVNGQVAMNASYLKRPELEIVP